MDTIADTQGPMEPSTTQGIDTPAERPGVPMEAAPSPAAGAHWDRPQRQTTGRARHLYRAGLDAPTQVFGNSVHPRGVSGLIRKSAYEIPEHYARHWMLLMAADRIDVIEGRLGDALAEPLEQIGFGAGAHYARRNPLAVVAGTLAGAWLAKKIIF